MTNERQRDMRVTMSDVANLAEILKAAQCSHRVARLTDGVRYDGEARRICDPFGGSVVSVGTDMRDLCLEVLLDGAGAIVHWPVGELMAEMDSGYFIPLASRKLASDAALRSASKADDQVPQGRCGSTKSGVHVMSDDQVCETCGDSYELE